MADLTEEELQDAEPDSVIVGYALLFGSLLPTDVVDELKGKVGEAPDGYWAAIFVYERDQDTGLRRKWTLFSADHKYALMLAGEVGKINMPKAVMRERFPAFAPGWVIDADED